MHRLLSMIVMLYLFCFNAKSQDSLADDHPIVTQIHNLDFSYFKGKPVDSLISYLPPGYSEMTIYPSINLRKAGSLVIKYAPKTILFLAVRTFNYLNPEIQPSGTPEQWWDINLFKKEALEFAVFYNGYCTRGCENSSRL